MREYRAYRQEQQNAVPLLLTAAQKSAGYKNMMPSAAVLSRIDTKIFPINTAALPNNIEISAIGTVLSPTNTQIFSIYTVLSPSDMEIFSIYTVLSSGDTEIFSICTVLSPGDTAIFTIYTVLSPGYTEIFTIYTVLLAIFSGKRHIILLTSNYDQPMRKRSSIITNLTIN